MQPVNEEIAARILDLDRRVMRLETLEGGCLALFGDIAGSGSVVTFSNIPQTHKHLWLWIHAEADANLGLTLGMTFNGDVGADYDWERMENSTLYAGANDTKIALGGTSTDQWVAHEVNILDYLSGNFKRVIWKGARTRGAAPCVDCTIIQGGALYEESEPITSIEITTTADDFGDTRFTLYGLC